MRDATVPRRRHWLVLVGLLLAATSCSEPRADAGSWRAQWDAVTAIVPDQADVEGGDRELCETTLGDLRTARPELAEAPEAALDATVASWFELAELMFFECPPDGEPVDGFEAAYAELASIEAEVDAVVPPTGEGRR